MYLLYTLDEYIMSLHDIYFILNVVFTFNSNSFINMGQHYALLIICRWHQISLILDKNRYLDNFSVREHELLLRTRHRQYLHDRT